MYGLGGYEIAFFYVAILINDTSIFSLLEHSTTAIPSILQFVDVNNIYIIHFQEPHTKEVWRKKVNSLFPRKYMWNYFNKK